MKRLSVTACVLLGGAVLAAGMRPVHAQTAASSSSSTVSSTTPAKKKKKKHHAKKEPKQMAPTPDRIEEIQSALATNGYYQGAPNGKWDSTSVAALQKFQSEHGLDATGKLDALSLQKLGLGSEIAGVSAPRTVKPATTNPVPSTTTPPGAKPQNPKAPDPSGGTVPSAPAASAPAAVTSPTSTTKPPTPPQPQ